MAELTDPIPANALHQPEPQPELTGKAVLGSALLGGVRARWHWPGRLEEATDYLLTWAQGSSLALGTPGGSRDASAW